MSDSGGFDDAVGVDLTFDDSASDPVPDGNGLVSGTYQPNQGVFGGQECGVPASFPLDATGTNPPAGPYGSSLSVFNNTDPTGDWQLYVIDDTASFSGSITGWSLDISTTTADITPPTVTAKTPAPPPDPPLLNKSGNVTATFSEEVQNVTTDTFILERNIAVKKTDPPKWVLVDATVSLINGVYVLDPVEDLPKGTYRATIKTDVTDMADNALAEPVMWTFTVRK
jgi:hypothetical protein